MVLIVLLTTLILLIRMMRDECYQFLKNEVGKVEIVGFGSYGQVKLARNTENNQIVAIKLIYNKNAKEEIDVHHKLNHPNIIKLQNYYYQKQRNITYMVLQYASGGSLHQKVKFGYGQLSKSLIRRYFKDICSAVEYLHKNNFMHRDIKTENILISSDNHAKLCDFGFASIVQFRSTLCGTFQYMAPQMIQKKPYDYKIDIWALGILLFELIQGYAPFRGETGEEVITEMKKSITFSNRFDPLEIDLIKKILRVNSENRPQVSKILEHPYFKQDNNNKETGKSQGNSNKSIKEQKEESAKQLKIKTELKLDPQIRKKEDKKFDFFHKKGQIKRQQIPKLNLEEKKEDKREFPKQFPKEEPKKQFKHFVPSNFQNPVRNLIRSPNYKIAPSGMIPISPTGFHHNVHAPNHQFNSSMQVQSTHQQGTFPSFPHNSNQSMNTIASKHFPVAPHHGEPRLFQNPTGLSRQGAIGESRNSGINLFHRMGAEVGDVKIGQSWKKN